MQCQGNLCKSFDREQMIFHYHYYLTVCKTYIIHVAISVREMLSSCVFHLLRLRFVMFFDVNRWMETIT